MYIGEINWSDNLDYGSMIYKHVGIYHKYHLIPHVATAQNASGYQYSYSVTTACITILAFLHYPSPGSAIAFNMHANVAWLAFTTTEIPDKAATAAAAAVAAIVIVLQLEQLDVYTH